MSRLSIWFISVEAQSLNRCVCNTCMIVDTSLNPPFVFNPKIPGGWGGQIDPLPPVVSRKMYLLKTGWNPVFFFTFNIILKTHLSKKFH